MSFLKKKKPDPEPPELDLPEIEPAIDPFLQVIGGPGRVYKLHGECFVTAPGGFGTGLGYPQFKYNQDTPELYFDDYIPRELKAGKDFLEYDRAEDPVRLSGDKWKVAGMPVYEAIIGSVERAVKQSSESPDFALIPQKAWDHLEDSKKGKTKGGNEIELYGPHGAIRVLSWPSLTTDGFCLWSGGWGWLEKADQTRVLLALKLQGSVRMIDMCT